MQRADLFWYNQFAGDAWQRIDAAMRLCLALERLGFSKDDALGLAFDV